MTKKMSIVITAVLQCGVEVEIDPEVDGENYRVKSVGPIDVIPRAMFTASTDMTTEQKNRAIDFSLIEMLEAANKRYAKHRKTGDTPMLETKDEVKDLN